MVVDININGIYHGYGGSKTRTSARSQFLPEVREEMRGRNRSAKSLQIQMNKIDQCIDQRKLKDVQAQMIARVRSGIDLLCCPYCGSLCRDESGPNCCQCLALACRCIMLEAEKTVGEKK